MLQRHFTDFIIKFYRKIRYKKEAFNFNNDFKPLKSNTKFNILKAIKATDN